MLCYAYEKKGMEKEAIEAAKDKAFEWLEKGLEVHDPMSPYLAYPCFDGIRMDPRFQDLMRRVGLPLGQPDC